MPGPLATGPRRSVIFWVGRAAPRSGGVGGGSKLDAARDICGAPSIVAGTISGAPPNLTNGPGWGLIGALAPVQAAAPRVVGETVRGGLYTIHQGSVKTIWEDFAPGRSAAIWGEPAASRPVGRFPQTRSSRSSASENGGDSNSLRAPLPRPSPWMQGPHPRGQELGRRAERFQPLTGLPLWCTVHHQFASLVLPRCEQTRYGGCSRRRRP